MIVIPAVEIRSGAAVAPSDGSSAPATPSDPTMAARAWIAAGFSRLYVVDADAIAGIGSNADIVEDLIRDSAVEVQANGGVQTGDGIQQLLDAGASRVVVGTRAIAEPEWLAVMAESNPGMVIVETTLRERRVVVRGWVRSLPVDIFDLIGELDGLPLGGLLVSAGHGDGNRGSTDLSLLEDIVDASSHPVMASGGALTMNDLRALEHRGITAVTLSGALFSGEIDPRTVAQEFGG